MKKVLLSFLIIIACAAHSEDSTEYQKTYVTSTETITSSLALNFLFLGKYQSHTNQIKQITKDFAQTTINPDKQDYKKLKNSLKDGDGISLNWAKINSNGSLKEQTLDIRSMKSANTFKETEAYVHAIDLEGGRLISVTHIPSKVASVIDRHKKSAAKNFIASISFSALGIEEEFVGAGTSGINSAASAAHHLRMADVNEGIK
jgi:hypothetical protein